MRQFVPGMVSVGKTALETWVALWFLSTRPKSKVVVTAPTIHQLHQIFMSEAAKWLNRSALKNIFEWTQTKITFKGAPAEWFLAARTAAKPENLAGFHADHLLFIIDEASGVEDAIYETILGALTGSDNKILIASNPTRRASFFYNAFHGERDLYHTFKVSSTDSSRVDEEYCARLIKAYGAESNVVRVRVLGEFSKAEADGVIPLELIESSVVKEKTFGGELIIGVDVARQGADLTVFAARLGDCFLPLKFWQSADLMTTTGRIVREVEELMSKYKKSRAELRIDAVGLGAGAADRLREVLSGKFITVEDFQAGASPHDKKYADKSCEAWFTLRERLQRGDIVLPADDMLAAELSTRRYSINSSGRLTLEPKKEFKKRIGRSPDRGDAIVMCVYPAFKVALPQFFLQKSYWRG